MKKVKRIFTAVLSLCLIMGLVATSTITSEAKSKKKSTKKAKAVATSTVNDPALMQSLIKGSTFTYNGKEYNANQISAMNLEQVANLMGLTVSKPANNGSIEDPWGGWAYENRAQADITDADSVDGLVHIQRFIDLRGDMPTITQFYYDGGSFEMMGMPCVYFNYDLNNSSMYTTYGNSWNCKTLDTLLRAGNYANVNDIISRNGLTLRTYDNEASWSAYVASDGWGLKDKMVVNGVTYYYHAYAMTGQLDTNGCGTTTTLAILKPDGSIVSYTSTATAPTSICESSPIN